MVDDAAALVAEAVAAPAAFRVFDYRDRIAAFGSSAVAPVMRAYETQPELGHFAVVVLAAVAKRGSIAAVEALHEIAACGAEQDLVKFTRASLRGLGAAPSRPAAAEALDQCDDWEDPTPAHTQRSVIDKINSARRRRGELVLDAAESARVLENLRRRAAAPNAYRNVCWNCKAVVTEEFNLRCPDCDWLVCWCGACREPDRPWPPTHEVGPCPIEAGFLGYELGYPDHDYHGRTIISANPAAPDAAEVHWAMEERGVRSLFHWTPARAVGSILTHGVLSRAELRHAGIPFVPHGYGSPEKEAALGRFVALTLRPKAVMMKAWSESPVVLEIDPSTALGEGTVFVPGNSASHGFAPDEMLSLRGAAAFERLWPSGRHEPTSQAEIWVRTRIPRRSVLSIAVETESLASALSERLDAARPGYRPPIEVRPELFAFGFTPEGGPHP